MHLYIQTYKIYNISNRIQITSTYYINIYFNSL